MTREGATYCMRRTRPWVPERGCGCQWDYWRGARGGGLGDDAEEIQWDWLEFSQTPWGEPAFVLVGALSFSGKCRAVICEGQSFAHLVEGIDGVLRRPGGRSRAWRTDRVATVVYPRDRPGHPGVRPGRQALRCRDLGLSCAPAPAQRCR